jgi:hypothetical protein
MSQKKVKAIRRLAKQEGKYNKEPNYKLIETKKMMYGTDKNGKPMAYPVVRTTLINLSKLEYRKMLKTYANGEFTI